MKTGWVDIPLEKLLLAPWNYKTEDEELARKLREGLSRNGQIETLLVRALPGGMLFEVVNGNHRLPVMVGLGFETAHCYNVGTISDDRAVRLAVELNETRFASDPLTLAVRLSELDVTFGREDLLTTLPFTDLQLDTYLAMAVEDDCPSPVDTRGTGTGSGLDDGNMTCPTCNGRGRVPRDDGDGTE